MFVLFPQRLTLQKKPRCLKIAAFFFLESTAHQGTCCVFTEYKELFLSDYTETATLLCGRVLLFWVFFPEPDSHNLLPTYLWKSI